MAKIMKRKFGGLEAQKFQFDILVGSMQGGSSLEGQELNVCWTRGAKIASTAHVVCAAGGSATWNENLSLICTMYRSSNGKYQEKSAKLAVREKKKKKTVGKVHFDLAEYCVMDGSKQVTMPLEVSTGIFSDNDAAGTLDLTIACRFLPPGDGGEYSEMTAMDASEMSNASDLCEEDEADVAPVPVDAPKAMDPKTLAAVKNRSIGSSLAMEPAASSSHLVEKNRSLQKELEQLKKDYKRIAEDAQDSAAEVKRLQKNNYELQDTLARQQGEGDKALCERIAVLEKELEEERSAKAAMKKELYGVKDELEQCKSESESAGPVPDDEQTAQLITSLVEAKIAYANSEEEKGNMGLKLVQLRRALAKERELNQQVSQRMTRLEVKAEKLKAHGASLTPSSTPTSSKGKNASEPSEITP